MKLWKRGRPVEKPPVVIRQRVSRGDWNRLYEGAPIRDILDDDTTHAVSPAGDVMKVSDTEPPEFVHMGSFPGTLEQAVDGVLKLPASPPTASTGSRSSTANRDSSRLART